MRDFHPHVPLVISDRHLEVRLGCACMEKATEDRESSISVGGFLKDRWLVARSEKCEGTCIVGPLASL